MSKAKGWPDSAHAKIAIITGVSLAGNPRPVKEAMSLAGAGFKVVVFGTSQNLNSLKHDQALARKLGFIFKSVRSTPRSSCSSRMQLALPRYRNALGRGIFRFCGFENRWQLGPYVPELLSAAENANADYYILHLEQALWVGGRLLSKGFPVGLDMEDWYSEDLLPEARKHRPLRLLRDLERKLLLRGAHASCPSRGMSEVLSQVYGCAPPVVIYNAFQWSERASIDGLLEDRLDQQVPSIHWFSQTIGRGRGLEDLVVALPHLNRRVEVHLRGQPADGVEGWLLNTIPDNWRDRVFIHPLVSNEKLLSRIAEHDIGFAGEMPYCRSRDLTVTNKILYYLLAGLAVVASDTAGQREVADQATGAVSLYKSGEPNALAACLNALLCSADSLARAKAAALDAAEQIFCWERQENVFLDTVANALSRSSFR
jgi:hypothetical protein